MLSAQFDHFGVPTTVKGENETYIAGAKVFITNPAAHPFRIEFLRFEEGSPMHADIQNKLHAAFLVASLDEALQGQNVIIPPFDATEELRCAFINDGGAIIEVMEKR